METHNVSFFGQKTALFINSASREEPHTWFRMIKKKDNQVWEKPSLKEGIATRISLFELGSILNVLEHITQDWKTMHKPKDGQAYSIAIKWNDNQQDLLFSVGNYAKKIGAGEVRLLYKLLLHFFDEKIKYATHGKKNGGGASDE